MNIPITLKIALRYWQSKNMDQFGKLITRLANLGIIIGITALITILSVMNGFENLQKNQRLANIPHILVTQQNNFSVADLANLASKLANQPTIQKVVAINQGQVVLQTPHQLNAVQIIGIDQFADAPFLEGQFQPSEFGKIFPLKGFNLLISERLASKNNLKVGDKVRVILTDHSRYTPFGQMPVERLFKIAGIYYNNTINEEEQIFTNRTDLGLLMGISPSQAQGLRFYLQDPFQVETVSQELKNRFPQWQFQDWRVVKGEFFQAVKMEKNMMSLLVSLIIIVAISNIITALSLMVVDKQREIAILQSLGLTRQDIRRIFIFQGGLVGFLGTIIGAILGVSIALLLPKLSLHLALPMALPSLVNFSQVSIIIFCSLTLTLLATLYPAIKASQTLPAQALREE